MVDANILLDMRYREAVAAYLFSLVFVFQLSAQTDAEKKVRKLERAWLDAYETRDAKAMDAIVGEEFFIIFPDGSKQTKPELMAEIRRPAPSPDRKLKFRTEDVKAKINGNIVVLSGRVITDIVVNGQVTSSQVSFYTDTYVRRGGRWQVIESHLTDKDPGVKR